jgi:hypothetical protein
LFKKRSSERLNGRNISSDVLLSTTPIVRSPHQILIDYIISHSEADQRPYLKVEVLGVPILGLLDSGASATIVGQRIFDIFLSLGLKLNGRFATYCQVANSTRCKCIGAVQTPISLMDKLVVLNILVVPELATDLILGTDFWLAMGIVPDLRRDVWHFSSDPRVNSVLSVHDQSVLTLEQSKILDTLLKLKFDPLSEGMGNTTLAEHEIVVDSPPIKQRYYPVSPYKQRLIDEELQKMLDEDVIEPSNSAWSSPVLLVPKRDGGYRFCVDYRKLNAATRKDSYPLPYISHILDRLRNAKYLSSLDIKSAYWQVPVKESSRELTSFTVPGRGLFQFKRMPYGLTNAPATWQRLIDRALGADLEPHVFVYLDDIVVISSDFDTHVSILEKVFDRLRAAGLTVKKSKCQFCRPELRYLGYVVDKDGLRVDPEKVAAIVNVPEPSTVTDVRSFIGMASWYRRFVPKFSSIVEPLTQLTKKRAVFKWTPECALAFRTLKEHLIKSPILSCPDFSRPFTLQTDASAFGVGAVLTQNLDGEEKVICFLSRSLTHAERKYSTTERECLGAIWAVEKLRQYLEGVRFTLITDHYSLLWLNRLKDPCGRLGRWALRLQAFDFEIVHRKGKEHVVPDFLSRSVPVIETVEVQADFHDTTDPWYLNLVNKVELEPQKYPRFRVENNLLYKYIRCQLPELASEGDYWKLVVPKDKRSALLRLYHDDPRSGHLGGYKVYWKLHNRHIWPGMKNDVYRYVRKCGVCAEQKPEQKRPAGLMGDRPEITKPWQSISLDFVGPLPRSSRGYSHILVVSDNFSKYVCLFPVRSANAKTLTRLIEEEIFLVYGVPEYLTCDNGVQMKSNQFRAMCDKYKVKIFFTALYYPRADPVERVNRVVKTMLSSYIKDNHRKWDEHLAAVGCAIRTAKHETTGYSPYFANFGRNYVSTGDQHQHPLENKNPSSDIDRRLEGFHKMFERISERLKHAHQRSKHQYNLRRRPVQYQPGDLVWRKNKILSDAANFVSAKLAPRFVGPYKIRRKTGTCTYELEDDHGIRKGIWHVQDLKPSHVDSDLEI